MYFSFKDYLSEDEAKDFFNWPHARQVEKVEQYLEFLAEQPCAAQFKSSPKASISWAVLAATPQQSHANGADVDLMKSLIKGTTRSGFGAFGTDEGFLGQKELSLAVAHQIERIGHTYMVEKSKDGSIRPPVLNSRSFFFYWCHAEKQKMLDIHQKLQHANVPPSRRPVYWRSLVIQVNRGMCADCIEFARCFAATEQAFILIQDPLRLRVFPPNRLDDIHEQLVGAGATLTEIEQRDARCPHKCRNA